MIIGFIGDLHGRVFHALAIAATWPRRSGRTFDALIQVGDLGAFPDPDRLDAATNRFAEEDPTELDFSRLLHAEGRLAESLQRMKEQALPSIHFIRGNHDDDAWLQRLLQQRSETVVDVDPFGLFKYVADGAILTFGDQWIAFLGGIETSEPVEHSIDPDAYDRLDRQGSGAINILVTHDAPYGISTGFHGQTQGSREITTLIEWLQPTFHIAGHYHHMNGPRLYGRTTYLGLNIVLPPVRRDPVGQAQPGCMAVLDTTAGSIQFVTDPWLADFDRSFAFDDAVAQWKGTVGGNA